MEQLIQQAATDAKRVMAGVQESQLGDPTPCSDFDVKGLANHMAGLLMGSERAAKKQERIAPPDPMPDLVGNNPGAAYAPLADAAAAAWSQPGALEGNSQFGPGEMPSQMAAAITLMEMSVHSWDMAAATGQQFSMAPEVAEAVSQTVHQLASPESRAGGSFGPEVQVGEGASAQEKLLAFSGRDPNWSA